METVSNPKYATRTTLVSSMRTSTVGKPVTLTVTVTDASPIKGTPTGTVTFIVNRKTFLAPMQLHGGKVKLKTSNLPLGTDTIEVAYSGDQHLNSSISPLLTETVKPATRN